MTLQKKPTIHHRQKSTKFWICDNSYADDDVKVRDHCHTTGKYKGFAHRDCNINVRLSHSYRISQLKLL